MPHEDGAYELVLPLVVLPRFEPTAEHADSDPLPSSGTLRPEVVGIDVNVQAGLTLAWMHSPSHEVRLQETSTTTRASTGDFSAENDFVLRWSVADEQPAAAMIVQDGHALLTLVPPDAPPRSQVVPREIIFVVDRSCSMGSNGAMTMVKRSMDETFKHLRPIDSMRVLVYSNHVFGHKTSVPATPGNVRRARIFVRSLSPAGGTYLLDGVRAALDAPSPAGDRERFVVFMTDGQITNERAALAEITDNIGDAHLFAFGAGKASNRWLLDEMARLGRGKTTWLRPGESPTHAARRFFDTIDKPVLSDIEVDWGDWEVEGVWPERRGPLFAGQPMLMTTRVIRQGTTPVVVRARHGEGRFERVIHPVLAEPGRSVPSTWARQVIGDLERDQLWGPDEDVTKRIIDISLSYQVLSKYTAFLAVDERSTEAKAPEPSTPLQDDRNTPSQERGMASAQAVVPVGAAAGGDDVLLVLGTAPVVSADSAHRGQVLTRDFLERVPVGRSYQSAATVASGVTGGSNPNIGGASMNESTYLLDGTNITDPVTGTFGLNVNYNAIRSIRLSTAGVNAEHTGAAGGVVDVVPTRPNNTLRGRIDAHTRHGLNSTTRSAQLGTTVAGPVVRDRLWFALATQYDNTYVGGRRFEGQNVYSMLTWQPNAEHRLTASLVGNNAHIAHNAPTLQRVGHGSARWQWFFGSDSFLDTRAHVQQVRLAGGKDVRSRIGVQAHASAMGVKDPSGMHHDLKAGVEVEHARWTLDPAWAKTWLATPPDETEIAARLGVFAQDRLQPHRDLVVHAGLRADTFAGRPELSPRLAMAWDPSGNKTTRVSIGYGRVLGTLRLLPVAQNHDQPATQELFASAAVQIAHDTKVEAATTFKHSRNVPTLLGTPGHRDMLQSTVALNKALGNAWQATAEYTHLHVIKGQSTPYLDDGRGGVFAHVVGARATWSVPTDPYTLVLSARVAGHFMPIALDPAPEIGDAWKAPRWTAGGSVTQRLPLRTGHLELSLDLTYQRALAEPDALWQDIMLQPAMPMLPQANGTHLGGTVSYVF